MRAYEPKSIEPKWQKIWEETDVYTAIVDEEKPKRYILVEFPYPSGEGLHVGHVRRYAASDALARFARMSGYNVLHPIGWDAFGLPAENFAIKKKIAPQITTAENIANFKRQIKSLGLSFDWSREVNTTDPSYYKWTQWLFLQFLKEGLAYQQDMLVSWCPKCKVGLANEEVVDGVHERCDTPVETKELTQWMLKITAYADKLIDGLENVDYPDKVSSQQINWIGKSVGAEVDFDIVDSDEKVSVFTTRPDTLFGATYLVIAPEHPLLEKIVSKSEKKAVMTYVETALAKTELDRKEDKEKTGVFTGLYAINPLTNLKIPVWVSDYVLMNYGTGAIMAVPAHDERDHEFAQKFDLPIVQVVQNESTDEVYTGEGVLINSAEYDGKETSKARDQIVKDLIKLGVAKERVNYKLHDWVFSRQRYWGEPIPVVHCDKCGVVPVPVSELPVILPEVEHYEPTDTGESPLAAIEEWVNTTCYNCDGPAKRETDTMPNWAGSSWYYLRYCDPSNELEFASKPALDYWLMVDTYIGGMEHTTLHLLYSRFWHQFFYDQGLVPTKEPYMKRRPQAMILAEDGKKMSKSLGNVVNPDDVVAEHGADSLRLLELFLGPNENDVAWSTGGLVGMRRFIDKVWGLVGSYVGASDDETVLENQPELEIRLQSATHKAIKKVTRDTDQMSFNTAIATLMELVNECQDISKELPMFIAEHAWRETIEALLLMLAPFAPHVAEELWQELGHDESIHNEGWPVYDEKLTVDDLIEIVVQINGKVRATITLASSASEKDMIESAQKNERVAQALAQSPAKKIVTVPKRLVNFVC